MTAAGPLTPLRSTLDEVVQRGYTEVGNIGTAFDYVVEGVLPLTLRVRVMANDREELLPKVPFSLVFGSTCCHRAIWSAIDDDGRMVCSGCKEPQDWCPTEDVLSILGKRLPSTLADIGKALENLLKLDPLRGLIGANDVVGDIERVHRERFDEAWFNECVERVYAKRPKGSNEWLS